MPATQTPADPARVQAQTTLGTPQKVYLWLTALFVASLLVSDFTGVKLFHVPLGFSFRVPWDSKPIDAIVHTAGMLTFPVTFLLTDLINEYFGKKAARRVVWIGFAMGAAVFLAVNLSLALPHLDAPYNIREQSFNDVFANSRIMYVASLSAYLVGSFSDIAIFGFIKRRTGGRLVWLRATGSTVISQLIDSFVVTWLAFSVGRHLFPSPGGPAPMTMTEVLQTAATGYLLKFCIALALTPVIYAGRTVMHRKFGLIPLPSDHA
ncbi:MAG: queuosine precursor transporter [Phycisphaerales bacterium]|nr:queuosine precursor transporter [Phycisphaerales bacterium]